MDATQQIIMKGKCCITGKPLKDCIQVNMLQLDKKATWKYPVWGNFITGKTNMAVAYVHDDCIIAGVVVGEVKNAVEMKDGEFIYHDIKDLQ